MPTTIVIVRLVLMSLGFLTYFVLGVLLMCYINSKSESGSSIIFILWPIWPLVLVDMLLAKYRNRNHGTDYLGRR